MRKQIISAVIFLLVFQNVYAQADYTKEFTKVMSFSLQPYLFYRTVITTSAAPVIQAGDTMSLTGVFYKNNANLYFDNGQEELFLQDSLLFQVSKTRKTIWISKVDMATRQRMNVLPVSNKQLQDIFDKRYIINKSNTDNNSRLTFQAKQNASRYTAINTTIALEYDQTSYLPGIIEIDNQIQEPVSDELLEALKKEEIDVEKLIKTIDGTQYFMRTQKMKMAFTDIDNTETQALKMPLWMSKIEYAESSGQYKGKGDYSDYEVTKMF